jgi:hypothetical protein
MNYIDVDRDVDIPADNSSISARGQIACLPDNASVVPVYYTNDGSYLVDGTFYKLTETPLQLGANGSYKFSYKLPALSLPDGYAASLRFAVASGDRLDQLLHAPPVFHELPQDVTTPQGIRVVVP